MEEICRELASLLTYDPGERRIPMLSSAAPLFAAATALATAKRVSLISGFYIGKAEAWETDGPLGTLILAEILERAGVIVTIFTDDGCLPIFESGRRLLKLATEIVGFPPGREVDAPAILADYEPDVLVAIERTGRAADGRYYNASGFDISQFVAHFDNLFLLAKTVRLPTVAVGDGGNELGFGAKVQEAQLLLGSASPIACVTAADYLVPCGVSNWGAYALAALYSRQSGSSCLCDEQSLEALLQEMVDAGAIDGVVMQRVPTVDGLPLQEEKGMFSRVMLFTQDTHKVS